MPTAEATREVVLRLPESLARDAECAGLLTSDALGELVRREMRMQALREIKATVDALGPDVNPPMTDDEVSAIVREVRTERRRRDSDSGRQ